MKKLIYLLVFILFVSCDNSEIKEKVDLHHGNELVVLITFECGGGKLLMDGQFSHLWRLSSDCN